MRTFFFLLLSALLLQNFPVEAAVCPLGTVATFFRSKKIGGNGLEKCVSVCGQENCSGIYVSANGCLAMNLEDFFGSMDEKRFVRKFCLSGRAPGVFVNTGMAGNLMGSVGDAKDLFECASLCLRSTICEFVAFDSNSKQCFYDADSKDNKTILPPTAVIHTRENIRYDAICENSDRSFALRPIQRTTVYGNEEFLEGGFSRDKCLDECAKRKCAYAIYRASKAKCSVFTPSENPEDNFKVKSTEYGIFENLCKSQVARVGECARENSIFVKDFVEESVNVPNCLERCLSEVNCTETRLGAECTTGRAIRKLCLSDAIDSDVGTLFEKSPLKCPRANDANRIERISFEQCLEVCVTHPTQSCGGVNYRKSNGNCDLVEIDSNSTEIEENDGCEHFVHSIFQFDDFAEEKEDAEELNWPFEEAEEAEKVNSNHIRRKPNQDVKPTPPPVADAKSDVSLKPICDYGSIKVVVNASGPHEVDVFPKDQSENCLWRLAPNAVQAIEFPGGNHSKCAFREVRENVFSQLIVVKRNRVEETPPVITFNDLIFNVTCDYRNIQKTTVTEIVHLKKNQTANNINVKGRVDIARAPISISLRSKRAQSVERVVLGQQIELVFSAEHEGTTDYSIPLCYATNKEGRENLTLIENGCPSVSVQRSLLIGKFRKSAKNFVLPFRAFKFANESEVRIVCVVEPCAINCDRNCNSDVHRSRRNLKPNVDQKQIELTFTVDEFGVDSEQSESAASKDFCLGKAKLVALTLSTSVVFLVQVLILFFFVFSNQKRRKTLRC